MKGVIRAEATLGNRVSRSFRGRLPTLALVLAALTALIVIIDIKIWREQGHLQEGFVAIQAEKFYFGVKFRGGVRTLNTTLLDYYLTGNITDLDKFRDQARDLKRSLATKQGSDLTAEERRAFAELKGVFDEFLIQITPLLEAKESPATVPQHFAATYAQVRHHSQSVIASCNAVVRAERDAFDHFLQKSDSGLLSLQRFFLLSLVLLVVLASSLGLLVYQGMLAPLQAQLTQSQAMVERQEKLASLGALAAGVAHEIRNPLTAIKFRLFSLKKSLPIEFLDNEDTHVISEEIDRLDRIVKDFLQFARPSEPRLVRVQAEQILTEIHQLMKAELDSAGVQLNLEIAQSAWIKADTQQLKQVLINLVQNSAESISNSGVITLRLSRAIADLGKGPAPAAILAVADSGKGIPPDVQKRLFDPFFTTKEGGTGLGLAIAARIVEKHAGLLQYKTEINRGTVFELSLMRLDDDSGNDFIG